MINCDRNFRKWQNIHSIVGVVFDPVHDVAFAPNLGRCVAMITRVFELMCKSLSRSYHMLAVASKDVDIIHLSPSGYVISLLLRLVLCRLLAHKCVPAIPVCLL